MQTIDFRYFPLSPNDVILDLGCGEGRHCINAYLHENIISIGVDLSFRDLQTTMQKFKPFVSMGQGNFYLQQVNADKLPFADASIDKIICSEVLEHIENYSIVLEEINRVLKPNGLLAISVPRYWPEKICWWLSDAYHQVEGGHIRIFTSKLLKQVLTDSGFVFYKRHWAHALHAPYWWLKCSFWNSQDNSRLIKLYHRFLVWDLMQKPWLTQTLEKCLNPLIGKSVVMYFVKQ
jgi:ubiquinone/menaquinone biosynthesis C-methylase UbiE